MGVDRQPLPDQPPAGQEHSDQASNSTAVGRRYLGNIERANDRDPGQLDRTSGKSHVDDRHQEDVPGRKRGKDGAFRDTDIGMVSLRDWDQDSQDYDPAEDVVPPCTSLADPLGSELVLWGAAGVKRQQKAAVQQHGHDFYVQRIRATQSG